VVVALIGLQAFLAQALLFVPVVPVLLTAGVLAARGVVSIGWAIAAAAAGVVVGDLMWYALGRKGAGVINRVCRWSIEPDTCVRRAQRLFGRYGARALLFSKFIPGLSTATLPLAGAFGMHPRRFVTYDAIGSLLWTIAYVGFGYMSARQLAGLSLPEMPRPGQTITIVLAMLSLYLLWKLWRRRAMTRTLPVERISAEDLRRQLQAREPMIIIDLRHPLDFERDPYTIPDALWIPAEHLDRGRPGDLGHREVVLYCTCPNEITSARCALRLHASGVHRVKVLKGGFAAWRARAYPVQFVGPDVDVAHRSLNVA
jgi:membrane protein DedA with SNARE-associated domain/rhodanese-related sulfurtransferase